MSRKPNVVYILADDMGYGDVSYLNENAAFQTENFDKMAREGIAFRDAHSSSAVCTPSRYSILTGRYNWRTSLKSGVLWGLDEPLIERKTETVASYLKKSGYKTACIGKWHLGLGWQMEGENPDYTKNLKDSPIDHGFDYFFGIPASLDMPPYVYIENNKVSSLPDRQIGCFYKPLNGEDKLGVNSNAYNKKMQRIGDASEILETEDVLPCFTKKVLDKIEEYKDDPFFIYFPMNAPHTPIVPTPEFQGKSGVTEYADFVLMCDDVVRQVNEKLEELGLANDTIVIYTSDNGCSPMANYPELAQYGHNPSYIFRGTKADIYEGGHRIPLLVKWPNGIPAGQLSDETVCLSDFFSTMVDIIEREPERECAPDSVSNLPVWENKQYEKPLREFTVHHSLDGSFSIRKGKWKLELCSGSGGWSIPKPGETPDSFPKYQLYDLEKDIREQYNVYTDNLAIAEELEETLNQCIARDV
ncbi:MAG: arylsulfatase [Spirochaetales bacterium]|nr:arylsulfatase [Spirochaetales bacterium]